MQLCRVVTPRCLTAKTILGTQMVSWMGLFLAKRDRSLQATLQDAQPFRNYAGALDRHRVLLVLAQHATDLSPRQWPKMCRVVRTDPLAPACK